MAAKEGRALKGVTGVGLSRESRKKPGADGDGHSASSSSDVAGVPDDDDAL